MKQRFNHFSKSTLSVILAVCMLLSCLTAGIVATNAAKMWSESVGYSAMGTILYDNSLTNWSKVYCFVLKSNYAIAYEMTPTKNPTVLSYTNSGWTDRSQFFFAPTATDAAKGGTNSNSRGELTGGSVYTDKINCSDYDANHTFFPASSSGGALTKTFTKVIASGAYDTKLQINPDTTAWSNTEDVMNATSDTVRTSRTYTCSTAGTYAMYMVNYNSDSGKINKIGTATGCTLTTEGSNLLITITQPSNVTITFVDDNDDDLDVTATPLETTHPVTVNISGTGTVTANSDPVTSGSSITVGETTATSLEATAGDNYHFVNWTFGSGITSTSGASPVTANPIAINATADNPVITANFAANVKYSVTSITGGIVDRTPAQYYEGETVTITPTVASGKTVDTVTVTESGGGTVQAQASGDDYTFRMPADDVSIVVTFRDLATITVTTSASPSDKGSVTPASGTTYTENQTIEFRATPVAGKSFDHWTVTEHGQSRTVTTAQFTQIAGQYDISAVAYFVDGYTVTVGIDTGGQIEGVSKNVAAAGETITVTYNMNFGYAFDKVIDNNNSGATVSTASPDANTVTFVMPASSVDYTVKLRNTVTTSTRYFYFGYKLSDILKSPGAAYDNQAFSEVEYQGNASKKFAYFKVSGRTTEGDQGFAVKDAQGDVDLNTVIVRDTSGSIGQNAPRFKFYSDTSGSNSIGELETYWTGEKINKEENKRSWACKYVPYGAKSFKVKYGNNYGTSSNLKTLSTSGNVYTLSSGTVTSSSTYVKAYQKYFWNNYKDISLSDKDVYNSGNPLYGSNLKLSFHNFNFYESTSDSSNSYEKQTNFHVPKVEIPEAIRGLDYYIVIYYPNTDYGKITGIDTDGSVKDITVNNTANHPVIVAQTFLPGEKPDPGVVVSNVRVVAKDGAVRRVGASRNPGSDQDYSTFEKHADTYLTDSSYESDPNYSTERKGYGSGDTYDYASKVEKGTTIYFKTTVDASKRGEYYVKAFSINGVVYQLHTPNTSTGVYTESFTIPEDYDRNYVEITPIYYLVNPGDTVRFTVQGYDDSVMNSGWGNTLYVYPYWSGLSRAGNAFGGYPGQPMIFYKGEYYIEIPVTYKSCTVKGMTLNNGYWDDIHYKVVNEVSKHHQTYDYDDFYKIYKEYPDDTTTNPVTKRRIICSFKFRTKKNNDKPNTVTPSSYAAGTGNGWEVLTNYEGQPVDIFGKIITDSRYNTVAKIEALNHSGMVHVISQDYKNNCAGHYATEWAVYDTSNNYKKQIIPSALVINENNIRRSNTPSGLTESQVKTYMKNTYGSSTAEFADEYVALDSLRDTPAMITYEKSIWGGDDPAERCDARWYWSYTSATVNANMRVKYSNDGGTTFTLDGNDPLADNETPSQTGAAVAFNGVTGKHVLTDQAVDTNISLSASETTNGYSFVGWYAVREGVAQFVGKDPSQSDIPLTSNVTFEARYVRTQKGYFKIGHLIHPASTGDGTVQIAATLKTGGTVTSTPTPSNGFVEFNNISYGKNQTIEVTLSSTPGAISTFEDFYATLSDLLSGYDAEFISNLVIDTSSTTKTATFTITVDKLFKVVDQNNITQTITSMTNYSKFGIEDVELDVNIIFTFPVRYYGTRNYEYRHVTITKEERLTYFPTSATITTLTPQYVMSKAPYESIFRKTITWGEPVISGLKANVVGTPEDNPYVYAVIDNGSGTTQRYRATHLGNFEEENNTTIYYVNKENLDPPQYFQYWNIYKFDDMELEGKVPVAKCFSEHFNYAGFEDYYVEAVYGGEPVADRPSMVTGLTTNATLLSITRSHWNNTTDGKPTDDVRYSLAETEYDRVYVDFVLSWANGGKLVNKDSKTFGYNLTYVDGETTKTIHKTVDKTEVDEKNRVEIALGIENLVGNASPTRTYTIIPTIENVEVGTASQSFCLYDFALPQAAWAR